MISKRLLTLGALPVLLLGLAACTTTNGDLKPSANCFPGVAQTNLNNVTPGKNVTVYNTGVDCAVDFKRDDRRIVVGLKSEVDNKTYAQQTVTAARDGQYRVQLLVPKNMPMGRAWVGPLQGITIHCSDQGSCAAPTRSVDVVTTNGFPQASFSPPVAD